MNTSRAKTLVVDDRRENLVAMQRILNDLDTELVMASSGNEALALTLEHQFALILLDVMMPEMDGFETATLLRQHEATCDIPIIFVTAIGKDDKQIFKGYKTGAVDYLFKPLDPDILKSKVAIFLEMHRQKTALNLANQELLNANEKILNQQKGILEEERLNVLLQMAGATAHELSQPLTALLFGINILEMDNEDPERRTRHIDDIKKAGHRISEIVKKIK
ncbi:MAG: response regulator, partial [Desulfobulbaceae bacterium]|nr:response regulator [Desulfobulbaceae bacterium]